MLKLSSITPVAFELAQLSDALWVSWAHSLLIERADDDKGRACFLPQPCPLCLQGLSFKQWMGGEPGCLHDFDPSPSLC